MTFSEPAPLSWLLVERGVNVQAAGWIDPPLASTKRCWETRLFGQGTAP